MYPSNQRQPVLTADDVFLLMFRIAIVVVVVIFQLVPEATSGWAAIWQEKSWPLADTVNGFGIPYAPWVVASSVVLAFLAALGLCCGFITRLSAAVLLGGVLFLGYNAVTEIEVVAFELALVYGCVFVFFVARGAGSISADRFFKKHKAGASSLRRRCDLQ